MTERSKEQLTSMDLLEKAEKALTPDQYWRMKSRAVERIGIDRLTSMSLEELRSELPRIASGDPEEWDILARLDREFTWSPLARTESPQARKWEVKFAEHPGDWLYEHLVPDRVKKARELSNTWASTTAIAWTLLWGIAAGEAIQHTEKAMKWWDKLKADPIAWIKDFFDALLHGRLGEFFSWTVKAIGVSTDMIEKFADKIGIPGDLLKSVKWLFSNEKFWKMSYGDLEKVWKEYQKNPKMDIAKRFWISDKETGGILSLFEKFFWKESKNTKAKFVENGGDISTLAQLSIEDFLKGVAG